MGQFYPDLNPLGIMPVVQLGLGNSASSVSNTNFTFDNRLGETDHDWLTSATETVTWLKGRHSFKAGAYIEYMRNNEARGGLWMGQFNFSRNTSNPLDTNYAFSNLLLGVFGQYDEANAYRSTRNRHWQAEWYAQDTWRASSRLTRRLRRAFPLVHARTGRPTSARPRSCPSATTRQRRRGSTTPARINGVNVAIDQVTGQVVNEVFVGTFVPGTGDPANGMVTADDPSYPRGFRDTRAPAIEPRVGVAYDLFGDNSTKLHASAGVFHNAVLGGGSQGNLQGPPNFFQSSIFYNRLSTFMAPGTSLAQRPVGVQWPRA